MVKCPKCAFSNEDGALFCENCKDDLSAVPSAPAAAPAETVPLAAVVDDSAPMAAVIVDEAQVITALPIEESAPMAAVVVDDVIPIAPLESAPAAAPIDPTVPVVPPQDVPAPPLGFYNAAGESSVTASPHAVEEAQAAAVAAAAPPPPAPPAPAPAPVAEAPAPAAPAAAGRAIPAGAAPHLVVQRGQKVGVEFPIYGGDNYIGRADDKPVDVDLEDQEPPDRVWTSRQHAVLHYDEDAGTITLEDLNSSNGTFCNRARVYPGQPRPLIVGDVIQIGTVHLKLKA